MNNAATTQPFTLTQRADGLYQVVNTRTGTRSIPLPKRRALRILKGVAR